MVATVELVVETGIWKSSRNQRTNSMQSPWSVRNRLCSSARCFETPGLSCQASHVARWALSYALAPKRSISRTRGSSRYAVAGECLGASIVGAGIATRPHCIVQRTHSNVRHSRPISVVLFRLDLSGQSGGIAAFGRPRIGSPHQPGGPPLRGAHPPPAVLRGTVVGHDLFALVHV